MLQVTRIAEPPLSREEAAVLREFASSAGGCRSAQHALAREVVRLRERQVKLERISGAWILAALAGFSVFSWAAGVTLVRALFA